MTFRTKKYKSSEPGSRTQEGLLPEEATSVVDLAVTRKPLL